MKILRTITVLLFILMACKNETNAPEAIEEKEEMAAAYPQNLNRVFNAHGGLSTWKSMKMSSFGMQRPNGTETTIANLRNRHSLIKTASYELGYNGSDLWVKETGTVPYTGNAKFYNGLMFYFYAMPFVLADDGIVYDSADALTFEGVTYPGYRISYNSGVGVSPEDQYIIYYHPETFEMSWLAYTVTFGKKEKSKDFRYIKYHDWETLNGVKLPKKISWFMVEDGRPTENRNTLEFIETKLSKEAPDEAMFSVGKRAKIID